MANICCDDVYFFSRTNPEGLRSLWEDLETSVILCNDINQAWIGNLLKYKEMDTKDICLQGTAIYMEWNEDNILLCMETKWSPLFDAYTTIAQTYNVEFVLQSIEPGENIYFNTDHSGIYFPDKYIISIEDEDLLTPSGIRIGDQLEYGQTFESKDALLTRFRDLGYTFKSLEELAVTLEDSEIYIHEFEDPYKP